MKFLVTSRLWTTEKRTYCDGEVQKINLKQILSKKEHFVYIKNCCNIK